eukprot:CAMPEP_0181313564 /NCGR_PEP_ID=MMETSP1101-20121128/14314_1 /TAXON_ID=46948 /ORGANISM="Rhodomonas abbreviata, Strain Caron Lab Isolate" /LENGTH=198 /DNA_ID=CAMNT_0023420523 /DNA_START=78 /DNA_END=671 /DNA_ORIENTATION=+
MRNHVFELVTTATSFDGSDWDSFLTRFERVVEELKSSRRAVDYDVLAALLLFAMQNANGYWSKVAMLIRDKPDLSYETVVRCARPHALQQLFGRLFDTTKSFDGRDWDSHLANFEEIVENLKSKGKTVDETALVAFLLMAMQNAGGKWLTMATVIETNGDVAYDTVVRHARELSVQLSTQSPGGAEPYVEKPGKRTSW